MQDHNDVTGYFNDAYWEDSSEPEPSVQSESMPEMIAQQTTPVPERKNTPTSPRPFGVTGPACDWKAMCNSWPVSFKELSRTEPTNILSQFRTLVKVPHKGAPIRKPCHAKRSTALRMYTRTRKGLELKCIPMKITSRLRSVKARGNLVTGIEYRYRDGKSIVIGGKGTKMQIHKSGDGIPQAFLVPNKADYFSIITETRHPSHVM
mmetsp:Transcript_36112/g.70175  ORF Transcript_36112/g.70175 Transcript_36112/m.70175 type:complete len:206 (-) Transcript_36112:27-644(-)